MEEAFVVAQCAIRIRRCAKTISEMEDELFRRDPCLGSDPNDAFELLWPVRGKMGLSGSRLHSMTKIAKRGTKCPEGPSRARRKCHSRECPSILMADGNPAREIQVPKSGYEIPARLVAVRCDSRGPSRHIRCGGPSRERQELSGPLFHLLQSLGCFFLIF
jgi:hypothetical protein